LPSTVDTADRPTIKVVLSRHAHARPQPAPKRAAAHRSGTGRLISHVRADHFAVRADTEDGRSVSYRSRELVV
jgi:hypothetical protein